MLIDPTVFLALASFAIVASITPGPNNLMVMASGAAFGWRRTLPHIAGVGSGFGIMIAAVVLGLGALIETMPQILKVLQVAGFVWLLWLAWQLAKPVLRSASDAPDRSRTQMAKPRPLYIWEAALFQWVNPKAWFMALGASATYSGLAAHAGTRALVMALTFMVVAPICNSIWTLAGQRLSQLAKSGRRARYFSLAMSGLVLVSAVLIIMA